MNRYALALIATACWATASLAQGVPPGGLNVNVVNATLTLPQVSGTNTRVDDAASWHWSDWLVSGVHNDSPE